MELLSRVTFPSPLQRMSDVHVVIMGCGRVGSTLAHGLEDAGHSVAVIDQVADSFRRLRPSFTGRRVTGTGFDRETLEEAGIGMAAAFAAVSNGDNSNILAARVARETFGLENVVARIYDPGRAEVYSRLGIPTVATVLWTADQMLRRLLPQGAAPEWRDSSGRVQLAEVPAHPGWIGFRLSRIDAATGARVAFLTRFGDAMLPQPETVLQDGDVLHVLMCDEDVNRVETTLASPPRGGG